jgi:serine/threonine protein kinase
MAPEYSMGKAIDTVKADVYSFGVILLEIVSGTVSAEYTPNQEEAKFLLDKVSVSDSINPLSFLFFFLFCSYYETKHVLPTLDDL